jgi:phage-related protein
MLLRRLQRGERLSMPASRSMPIIGRRCHELRIVDADQTWRIIYRVDTDAVVIAEVFSKKTTTTPGTVIDVSRTRLRHYDESVKG